MIIKHSIHPWWEIEDKINNLLICFKFNAIIELIRVDVIIIKIIGGKKFFEMINKGKIFWNDNNTNNALGFNEFAIIIIQKWKGIIANLIRIAMLIKIKKIREEFKKYWKLDKKNNEDEKDWMIK